MYYVCKLCECRGVLAIPYFPWGVLVGAEKRSTHPSHQTFSPCVLSRMAGTSIHSQGYWLSSSLVQAGILRQQGIYCLAHFRRISTLCSKHYVFFTQALCRWADEGLLWLSWFLFCYWATWLPLRMTWCPLDHAPTLLASLPPSG